MELKIGELAKRCSLSVRTLYHYDSIGLLSPTLRTAGGARIYGSQDLARLHRILVLKDIGYALADIRTALDDTRTGPLQTIRRQIDLLETKERKARELSTKLKHIAERLTDTTDAVETVDWLDLLEMTALYEQHLSETEVQAMRSPATGSARDIESQRDRLIAEVRQCMLSDARGASPQAHAIAWRWVRMVIALTSNNPALASKLKTLQEREVRAQELVGIDAGLIKWIGEAIVHARVAQFSKYMSDAQAENLRSRQLAHKDDWPPLVAQVREHMALGTCHDALSMKLLANRWVQLFRDSYSGGDLDLESKVRHAMSREPDLQLGVGVDDALMRYVRAAIEATEPT
ncbi:MerR family transcriptional regulator [Acidovorax facilis]|uniref:MerR family transcriptional regulator n=1 Tax=Acidovorax facilis TaxID=12917 RepID=UPI003CE8C393